MIYLCAHKLRLSQKLIPVNSKKNLSRHYMFNMGIVNDCILSIRHVIYSCLSCVIRGSVKTCTSYEKRIKRVFRKEKNEDCSESFVGKTLVYLNSLGIVPRYKNKHFNNDYNTVSWIFCFMNLCSLIGYEMHCARCTHTHLYYILLY